MSTQNDSSLRAPQGRLPVLGLTPRGNYSTSNLATVLQELSVDGFVAPSAFQQVPFADPQAGVPRQWRTPWIRMLLFLQDAPTAGLCVSTWPSLEQQFGNFFSTFTANQLAYSRDGVAVDSIVAGASFFEFPPQQGWGFFGSMLVDQNPAQQDYNEQVAGNTPTNDVPVSGYAGSTFFLPRNLYTIDGGGDLVDPATISLVIGTTTKSAVTEGFSLSQIFNDDPAVDVHVPVILRESDYTQAVRDAGDVIETVDLNGQRTYNHILGLWDSPGLFPPAGP